jgi:hypothetical protein
VIGHLAEAEAECIANYPDFANEIREYRKEFEADEHVALPYEQLILDATQLDEEADEQANAETVHFTPGIYNARTESEFIPGLPDDIERVHAVDRDAAVGMQQASRVREEAKD